MFGLFKKKTPLEKLHKRYEKLMEEAFVLSRKDRRASDAKTAEAEDILAEIKKLETQK